MVEPIKDLFLLDPDVVYLNHGSYGACSRPVFERYQAWQRDLESNPVAFLSSRVYDLLAESRAALGAYLGVSGDNVVYFANPTTAIRLIVRAMHFGPGDEVLTTDWEYPTTNAAWDLAAYQTGLRYIHQPVPVPFASPEEFVDGLWQGVTPRTRIIFLSHISFSNALIFPVGEVCRRARSAGITTVIDGAHAPSQIPLNLADLDVDLYVGRRLPQVAVRAQGRGLRLRTPTGALGPDRVPDPEQPRRRRRRSGARAICATVPVPGHARFVGVSVGI